MFPSKKLFAVAVACALGAGTLTGCKDESAAAGQQAQMQRPPVVVSVVTVKPADVVLESTLPGRTNAYNIAEVRPQVNGILQKRLFKEGAEVKAGEQLYQIDPAAYEAALTSAQAGLSQAQATLVKARSDAKRSSQLLKAQAVSQQADDAAQAAYKAAVAAVAAGEAAVKSAKINLDYTKVYAPIDGRVSRSAYTEGALMAAYQGTPMTTIQQLDPIYVDVTQSAEDLLRVQRDIADGKLKLDAAGNASVVLHYADGSVYPEQGKLTFTDVSVNEATGTVNLRAVFPNPRRELLPGLYVRAQVIEGVRENSIAVPMQCVMRDAKGGATVYVVGQDGKIEARPVKAERNLGNRWLIESGLNNGDKVVFDGFQRVRPGAQVTVEEADLAKSVAQTGKPIF